MINSVNYTNTNNYEKNTKLRNKGLIKSLLCTLPIGLAHGKVSDVALKSMKNISQLTENDFIMLQNSAQEALSRTGLKEKGVDILRSNDKKTIDIIKTELNLNKLTKGCSDSVKNIVAEVRASIYKTGSNAAFFPKTNKIILPEKLLQTSVFHEMGHALNCNDGKILKLLQKSRYVSKFAPIVILMISLLNKRKTTDEPSNNKSVRILDGIKKNAGKLTTLAMLPTVLEEGIASLRGDKIARGLVKDGKLTKEILNKVRLNNVIGFATYVLSVVATVLSTKLAIKFKDNIQKKYETKKIQKN